MARYLIEEKSEADLATAYPHDPENLHDSLVDYLEYQWTQGFDLASVMTYGSGWEFIFRPVTRT